VTVFTWLVDELVVAELLAAGTTAQQLAGTQQHHQGHHDPKRHTSDELLHHALPQEFDGASRLPIPAN
jgi:hypothetical protein